MSIQTNFVSSKDSEETYPIMRSWSEHVEIMMSNKTDDVINMLIEALRKERVFFNSVDLLYYNLHT